MSGVFRKGVTLWVKPIRPGAQQQSNLDERLSPFRHYGRAAASAMLGDQPEVRLREIMGVVIDGRYDGHGQLPPW